jgi:hypothetical protein
LAVDIHAKISYNLHLRLYNEGKVPSYRSIMKTYRLRQSAKYSSVKPRETLCAWLFEQ